MKESVSDALLILGGLVIILALALIWKPLGILAAGIALLGAGVIVGMHK